MKKKRVKIIIAVILIVLIAFCGICVLIYRYNENKKTKAPGNSTEYDLNNVNINENSPLEGKRILFLGSSVTYGAAAQGVSFVDYLEKMDGVVATKEAISATTLVDEFSFFAFMSTGNGDSYVTRLKNVDASFDFDAVVVQLSTNDATMNKELGALSNATNSDSFDVATVTGAIEYITCYSMETWGCPVIFYTGSYYESDAYSAMVGRLYEVQEKWGIGIVDMYTDAEFNDIDEGTYHFYMYDNIHPTKAGYLEWWLPEIEAYLTEFLQ